MPNVSGEGKDNAKHENTNAALCQEERRRRRVTFDSPLL